MSTALYRRYRPDTFAEVIGQEHVTEPLVAAIDSGRINHAYLFSGPRGCGKTTSARIFARCLNCAEGPTGTPCGACDSCIDLATGGSGSLDVVELDAASHGGVDDARDLRERAIFAPARDRYKIFIIDEAHMVTTQGFNALLKLVEEPPDHVKFVFATTEPEKVIGTIRSRTHHYPFRLVPPERLGEHLAELSRVENIQLEDGVIPLVVRAGAGSVRDSLSVLDQLMAGAIDGVVSYQRAVALLGYTPEGLLDDVVAALAAQDGAGLFAVVDQVISSGHDPRRFAEDLLERFRDLIVVLAAGKNARAVMPHVPDDQLQRMHTQATHLGAATCSRAADLVHEALDQMAGATSPRLQLELLCARLLLPTADEGVRALAMRLERVESAGGAPAPGQGLTGADLAAGARPAPTPEQTTPSTPVEPARQAPQAPAPAPAAAPEMPPTPPVEPTEPVQEPARPATPAAAAWQAAAQAQQQDADGWPSVSMPGEMRPGPDAPSEASAPAAPPVAPQSRPEEPPTPEPVPTPEAPPEPSPAPAADQPATGLSVQQVRNRWQEVLQALAKLTRVTWSLISQDGQVVDLQPDVLTIGFSTSGLATRFQQGNHAQKLSEALQSSLGLNVRIETTIVGPTGRGGASPTPVPAQEPPQTRPAASQPPVSQPPTAKQPPAMQARSSQQRAPQPPPAAAPEQEEPPGPAQEPPPWDPVPPAAPVPPSSPDRDPVEPPADEYDEYSPDDAEIGGSDLVGAPLVAKVLGGTVIDEIIDEGRA